MPIPPIVAAAAISAGASILSNLFNRANQENAQKFNKEENELAYLRSLPSTQVQQWKDAGLNPNLIYTQGQAASYQPVHAERTEYDFSGAGDAMSNALGMHYSREEQKKRMQGIDLDNRTKELNNQFLEASLLDRLEGLSLSNSSAKAKIVKSLLDSKLALAKERLTNKQYEALDTAIRKGEQEIINLVKLGKIRDLEAAEKELTLALNEELKPHGVTVNDPLWARMIIIHLLPKILELLENKNESSNNLDKLKERAEEFIANPETNFSPHIRR